MDYVVAEGYSTSIYSTRGTVHVEGAEWERG
jgi:hypothetical protein